MKLNDIPMTDWYWLVDDGINITVRRMKLIDDGTNNMKLDTNIWLMDVWWCDWLMFDWLMMV